MDYAFAWEKLLVAVQIVASGSGSLEGRLKDAYTSSLIRIRADRHLDDDLQQQYIQLRDAIASDDPAIAPLSAKTDEELQQIAVGLVSLFDKVARRLGES
jgi:hypothetical protein